MNIVDGFQKKYIYGVEKLIMATGWFFMLWYLVQIVLSLLLWTFNLSNIYQKLFMFGNVKATISTLFITIVSSIFIFVIIHGWGRYNFKKYAHLRRRKFPEGVSVEEIVEFFKLSPQVVGICKIIK